jgi:hypothetical protein
LRTAFGEGSPPPTSPEHLEFLNFLRWILAAWVIEDNGGAANESAWSRPYYGFALFQTNLPASLPQINPRVEGYGSDPAWIGILCHRILAFLSIWGGQLEWTTPSSTVMKEIPPGLEKAMVYTRKAVFDCIKTEVETAENGKEWAKRARAEIHKIWKFTETSLG